MNKSVCKAVLIVTLSMSLAVAAWSETGIDPGTPEGREKIANFKRAYISKCNEDVANQAGLEGSPLRDAFLEAFRAACSCGAERGLSKFSADDYRTLDLSIDDEAATSRMNEGTVECNDAAMKTLQDQQ